MSKAKLNVTKKRLYNLVMEYRPLPIMKKTEYKKYRNSHWLEYINEDDDLEIAFFTINGGAVRLSIRVKERPEYREFCKYSMKDLESRGLIKYVA
jgi:hypothetical protein